MRRRAGVVAVTIHATRLWAALSRLRLDGRSSWGGQREQGSLDELVVLDAPFDAGNPLCDRVSGSSPVRSTAATRKTFLGPTNSRCRKVTRSTSPLSCSSS